MANFVYNPHRSGGSQRQWYDFQQKSSFHDDLVKTFQTEAINISRAVSESTSDIVGSLDEGFDGITGVLSTGFDTVADTLGIGFSDISGKLNNINSSIENIALMLDWSLSEVINQQRISNLLLENIVLLLRVPDFQKERQYYIEQGFKHYKNASLDSDLYEDALHNLLEAEKRETTDYIVLYQIGMVFLHSKKEGETQNLARAEEYFRRAAKYAIVESNPASQKMFNILAGEANRNISTTEAAKEFAAKAYFHAGIACYGQGKFPEAIELSEKAYSLLPSFLEAGFLQAKSLAVFGKAEQSVRILRGLIQIRPFYFLKASSDSDLEPKSEVRSMLEEIRDNAVNQASDRLSKLKVENINEPQFTSVLSKAELLIRKNTFVDALKALNELTKKRKWEIKSFNEVLCERFLQDTSNFEETDRKIFFNTFQQHRRSYQKWLAHNPSIEDFVLILRKISSSLQEKIERKKQVEQEEIERKKRAEAKIRTQTEENIEEGKKLKLRLEEDRRQINEFLSKAKKEENRNRSLAISLYEQAAKLGSYEAGQKLQDLKGNYQKQFLKKSPQEEIKELLLKAQAEEVTQNQKWLFKKYDLAISLYEQAAKLGSYEAKQRLHDLKRRLGLTQ